MTVQNLKLIRGVILSEAKPCRITHGELYGAKDLRDPSAASLLQDDGRTVNLAF